jgi:hypothetical protein
MSADHTLAVKPLLLPYPRMYVRQLFLDLVGQFTCGRRAGCKLSRRVPGAHCDDLLNLNNNWMKNIVASGFFLVTLFLAEEEKVTGSKGFGSKPTGMMARSVPFSFKK